VRLKTVLLLPMLLACALAAAGCRQPGAGVDASSSGDVDSVIGKLNSFTNEVMTAVESAPDPSAGVASAQKLLDSRMSELAGSIAALKRDARFQQDAAAKRKWLEAEVDNTDRVHGLGSKFFDASMRDPAFKSRLDKLVGDYDSMFRDTESR